MDQLPYELIVYILAMLDRHSIYILHNTSRRLRNIVYQKYIEPEFQMFASLIKRYINYDNHDEEIKAMNQCQDELRTYPCNLIIYHKDFELTSLSVKDRFTPPDNNWYVGKHISFEFWIYSIQKYANIISEYYKYLINTWHDDLRCVDKAWVIVKGFDMLRTIFPNKHNFRMFLCHPTIQPDFILQLCYIKSFLSNYKEHTI